MRHQGRGIHPLPVEAAISALSGVRRAALINTSAHPEGVLVIEGEAEAELLQGALEPFALGALEQVRVSAIPMDYRHQSKIDRVALRAQLEGR